MIDSYRTLRESAQARITRKRSRFIAVLEPVGSGQDANEALARLKRKYHDATHHCYALRMLDVHTGQILERSEDDGEPSGSAGLPMLHVLRNAELVNVLAVVTRYFGGSKLGVGGLIRAYGDSTTEALAIGDIVCRDIRAQITIQFPVEVNSGVMSTIHRFAASVKSVSYEDVPVIVVTLPPSQLDAFATALAEASGARARLVVEK